MKALVSVIVPVYNVDKYIDECILSIINQTYKDIEIILVNDGSTDQSAFLCEKYASQDSRIVLLNKENGGIASARNYGLDRANGKFICFVDSDDSIDVNMIQELTRIFEEDKETDVVVCGFNRYDSDTGNVLSREMIDCRWQCIRGYDDTELLYLNTAVWNKMYKKTVLENIRFENISFAEDFLFIYDMLKNTNCIKRVSKSLYNYRVRKTSLMNTVNDKRAEEFYNCLIKRRRNLGNDDITYINMLDALVFLHLGISLTFRLVEGNFEKKSFYINKTKRMLDNDFSYWRSTPHLSFVTGCSFGIKGIGLWGCRLLYKINLFVIFVWFYGFVHKKLKIDIKW